ncbi:hypothetical protein [Saccharothrix deserti]|uniref:hypothetical protein n=1 Tax=Saccharothrix deserti TaxID=2593674 RepID=UPI00131D417A|nr:hypothetical protein [Saccharothrix deserti]
MPRQRPAGRGAAVFVAVVAVAALGATGFWAARVVPGFLGRPLAEQANVADVVGMIASVVGVLVSAAALVTAVMQLRRTAAPQEPDDPAPSKIQVVVAEGANSDATAVMDGDVHKYGPSTGRVRGGGHERGNGPVRPGVRPRRRRR